MNFDSIKPPLTVGDRVTLKPRNEGAPEITGTVHSQALPGQPIVRIKVDGLTGVNSFFLDDFDIKKRAPIVADGLYQHVEYGLYYRKQDGVLTNYSKTLENPMPSAMTIEKFSEMVAEGRIKRLVMEA